jgi:type IV pilus assembly protein PilM
MNYLTNLFQRNQPGIGIELGPEKINIAEIRQKGNKLRLVNFATAEVPEEVFRTYATALCIVAIS